MPPASKPVLVLAGLMFLIGPLAAVARQGLTPLLFLVLLTLAFIPDVRATWRAGLKAAWIPWALPFFVWACASNLWAPQPQWAAWGQMFITVLAGVLLAGGARAIPQGAAKRILQAAVIGVVILLVFLLEESMSGAAVLSWARPEDVQTSDAMFFSLIMSLAARGTSVLAVLGVLFAVLIYRRTQSGLAAGAFLLAAFYACASLPMSTSALGLVAAVIAFLCVLWRPRVFLGAQFALLAMGIVLAGPAAHLIPSQAHVDAAASQLELGAQHRLGIWRHVSGLSDEKPIMGHGFNAARFFAGKQDKLDGLNLPALPTHPHNAPLQIWLELGAVGAILGAAMILGLWRAARPIMQRPLHSAVVASIVAAAGVVACFSYSLWSTWWLASLGLMAALAALALNTIPAALTAPE